MKKCNLPMWASHLPLLCAAHSRYASHKESLVLEFGAGVFSTQLLSAMQYRGNFHSFETSEPWYTDLLYREVLRHPDHQLHLINGIKDVRFSTMPYSVDLAFVDANTAGREPAIRALAEVARVVVVHDTDYSDPKKRNAFNAKFAQRCWDAFDDLYAFRFDYHGIGPSTSIVSNVEDVAKEFEPIARSLETMINLFEG